MLIPYHDDNPLRRFPVVTVAIIGINVGVFLLSTGMDEYQARVLRAQYGFVPLRISQLVLPDTEVAIDLIPEVAQYSPRQIPRQLVQQRFLVLPADPSSTLLSLVTCMFLHGSWIHLIGNLWFLWIFGNNIEDRLGHFVYLLFYLLGGMVALVGHWWMIPESQVATPVIGASGAVAVMLGAYAVTYPLARIHCILLLCLPFFIDLPAMLVLGVWMFGQIASAINAINLNLHGGVAWWAHIVGFATGALVMPFLKNIIANPPPRHEPSLHESGLSHDAGEPGNEWKVLQVDHNDPNTYRYDPRHRWLED